MTPRAFGRIAGLACFLTVFACAPAGAQINFVVRSPNSISYGDMMENNGVTVCTEQQTRSYIASDLSENLEAEVKAHEHKHVEQRGRFPSCAAFLNAYRTPRGTLEMEAEAYVAGFCVAITRGADPIPLWQSYAERIERQLGGEVNRLMILQTMQKYRRCAT